MSDRQHNNIKMITLKSAECNKYKRMKNNATVNCQNRKQ